MNIFAELMYSVTSPKRYESFLQDKKLKTFWFGFLLVLIYFFITIMVPFIRFEMATGGIVNTIDYMVPDFTIEDGTVQVSEPVDYTNGDMYIYVDTDNAFIDETELKPVLRSYPRVLIMDSEQAVIKNSTQTQIIAYEDLDRELYMTKELLMDSVKPMVSVVLIAGLAIIFVGMELLFFFGVLFVALLGMIVASCMQYRLTFGQLYKLGIYTRTTPLLIKAVMSFLPFGIPFFIVISMGISLLYLSAAIRHMKTPVLQNGPLSFSSGTTGPQNQVQPWNGGNQTQPWNGGNQTQPWNGENQMPPQNGGNQPGGWNQGNGQSGMNRQPGGGDPWNNGPGPGGQQPGGTDPNDPWNGRRDEFDPWNRTDNR